MLGRVEVVPVFTAHPTEVARRTVLFKRARIAAELERLDSLPLSDRRAREAAERIAAEITGREVEARSLPRVVSFGSWIGGDRDGNPYVTPGCTRDALRMARDSKIV